MKTIAKILIGVLIALVLFVGYVNYQASVANANAQKLINSRKLIINKISGMCSSTGQVYDAASGKCA